MKGGLIIGLFFMLLLSSAVFVSAVQITGQMIANPTSNCTDSDGASNERSSGVVTLGNGTILEDTCCDISNSATWLDTCPTTKDAVIEYYCSGSNYWGFSPIPCDFGYMCSDGVCVPQSTTPCTDSDGGVNRYVKGTTTDSLGTGIDFCYEDGFLGEYSCVSDYSKQKGYIKCGEGYMCNDGVCVVNSSWSSPPPCTDSDEGDNYYTRGKVTVSTGATFTDSCVGSILYEKYCTSTNEVEIKSFVCPYSCSEGACLSASANETPSTIIEEVACAFGSSSGLQKCYTSEQNSRAYCSGKTSCVATISGYLGEKITWKSSCGGYAYTVMNGAQKNISFDCVPEVASNVSVVTINNKGFRFAYWQCYDGEEMKFGNEFSCNFGDTLKRSAQEFCSDNCKDIEGITKCGVNSFSVLEECYSNSPYTETQPSLASTAKEISIICKDSCPLEGKCYPFGYRKSGEYCSDTGQFVEQLEAESSCDNNFECDSNVCANDHCISKGFLQKILDFFKNLFGGQ